MKKSDKKSRKLSVVAMFGLLLALVLTFSVSVTYAKYTTSVTGTDTATIAKWSWKFGSTDLNSGSTTYTLDLFKTIKDSDGTSNETDVKNGATGKVIAPGTSGSFDIVVRNNSDVNATYAVTFTETNELGAKIEYSTDGGTTWGTVSTLNVTTTNIAMNEEKTIPIKWRWVFENSDAQNAADTAVGFNDGAKSTNVQVQATVNLVQAD